jgi:hypothetical protein
MYDSAGVCPKTFTTQANTKAENNTLQLRMVRGKKRKRGWRLTGWRTPYSFSEVLVLSWAELNRTKRLLNEDESIR